MDGNKFLDTAKTVGEATGLLAVNAYVWLADILGLVHQILAIILSLGSLYLLWLRIKYQIKKGKKGDKDNGNSNLFIG